QPAAHTPPDADDVEIELASLDIVIAQGRDRDRPAEPGTYPPPQYGEGIDAAYRWLTGEDTRPPVDHHGCGAYFPLPGRPPLHLRTNRPLPARPVPRMRDTPMRTVTSQDDERNTCATRPRKADRRN